MSTTCKKYAGTHILGVFKCALIRVLSSRTPSPLEFQFRLITVEPAAGQYDTFISITTETSNIM